MEINTVVSHSSFSLIPAKAAHCPPRLQPENQKAPEPLIQSIQVSSQGVTGSRIEKRKNLKELTKDIHHKKNSQILCPIARSPIKNPKLLTQFQKD